MKGLVNKTGGDRYMAGTTKGKGSEGMTDKKTKSRKETAELPTEEDKSQVLSQDS